jgi:hypothetical protein
VVLVAVDANRQLAGKIKVADYMADNACKY